MAQANCNTTATETPTALRRDAVLPTAVSLIRHHSANQSSVPRLSLTARIRLSALHWAGGVAELDRCIQQALVLCDGVLIEAEHLQPAEENSRRVQSNMLRSLRAADGERDAAAKTLGIRTRTLRENMAGLREQGFPVPERAPAVSELSHE